MSRQAGAAIDPEELYVSACFADEGTTLKRWRPRARGRATRIRKRTCHITVIVSRLDDEKIARLARQAHRGDRRTAQTPGRGSPTAPARRWREATRCPSGESRQTRRARPDRDTDDDRRGRGPRERPTEVEDETRTRTTDDDDETDEVEDEADADADDGADDASATRRRRPRRRRRQTTGRRRGR